MGARARRAATSGQSVVGVLVLLGLLPVAASWSGSAAVELRLPFPAYSVGGVTLVPLRPVAEWAGAEVRQTAGVVSVVRARQGKKLAAEVRVGSATALVDGRPLRLRRAAVSTRGEVCVPLEFLTGGLGVKESRVAGKVGFLLRDGSREVFLPAMAARYPVVVANGGYLLGGVEKGEWVDAQRMAPLLRGGERYWVYSSSRFWGTAVGAKPKEESPGEYQCVELAPPPGDSERAVAIGGPWEAIPRKPVPLSPLSAAYLGAVRDVLRANGLAKATPRITQVVRVDLEGDGTDEVIITAKAPGLDLPAPSQSAGDYSFVMLRKVVRGKVETSLLGSGFYKETQAPATPTFYTFHGVLDLDGDGAMEILVADAYYEGVGMVAYQIRAGKPVAVLSGGYGV